MSEKTAIVILGVTGHLSQTKLIPALHYLKKHHLANNLTLIGVGRRDYKAEGITYVRGNFSDKNIYKKIKSILKKRKITNKIYYLATYPEHYKVILRFLNKYKMNNKGDIATKIIIEKPIGYDLKTGQKMNRLLAKYYIEDQIFRLDHYLGKETLQNILTFRFNNEIFEPIINKDYIKKIELTWSQDFGIGDRGGYYDTVGALKDVGQNHILQMIALVLMDQPKDYTNKEITKKRIELIESLIPVTNSLVLGQYDGYLKEKDVPPSSKTETYFAFKTYIMSNRFKGVPIFVKAGNNLSKTVAEISIVFKSKVDRVHKTLKKGLSPNILTFRIQPNEAVILRFVTKIPGYDLRLKNDFLEFRYKNMGIKLPDPHAKLILDIIKGEQTFFIDARELVAQWKFIEKFKKVHPKVHIYKKGSSGPKMI